MNWKGQEKNAGYGTDLERQRDKQRAENGTIGPTISALIGAWGRFSSWPYPLRRRRVDSWRNLMRISNSRIVDYETVGLSAPYRPKYFDRSEYHQTLYYSDVLCAAISPSLTTQSETAGASYCKVCDSDGRVWMGNDGVEDLSLIIWHDIINSRDRAIDGENWCVVLHGRLVVIPNRTAEEEEDWDEEQATP